MDAADAMVCGDGARARAAGELVAERLRTDPFPTSLDEALTAAMASFRQSSDRDDDALVLVVRSSAVGEDGEDRSHAGQYESLLNVAGLDRLRSAVREVWASWYSERAISYRLSSAPGRASMDRPTPGGLPGDRRAGPITPPMAVILQKMVMPRASGMLFTADPVTGDAGEMMIESAPGLGEALAQARVHPDLFRVRRPVLGTGALDISERSIAPKDHRLIPFPLGSGELVFQPLPDELRLEASLSDQEVLELAGLGLRVEEELGGPLDIEWVVDESGALHIVQARPVTGPKRQEDRSSLRARPILWTQRFSGERWTELATPLGWSLVQPVLHHFTFWEGASERWLSSTPPTRLYRGRPYFNLSIFRHLVFRLPGGSPPQFILEMFPPGEQEELRHRGPFLPNLGLVGSIVSQLLRERRWERYHYNFVTNHQEWDEFRPEFEARVQALSLAFTEAEDGLETVGEARSLMVEYVGVHLLSLLFAHLSYEALDRVLRSWVGLSGEALRSALVANCEDNQTLRCNRALWELALRAAADESLRGYLTGSAAPSLDGLDDLPGGPAFRESLHRFLGDYGHRSSASWEVFAPRWADSPELVLRLVAGYLRSDLSDNPIKLEQRRRSDRERAERLVRSRMARTSWRRLVPWRQQLFERLLAITRRYVLLRENQRFSFDRLLLRLKQVLERVGALLERDGLLDSGADIVFLEIDEVSDLTRGLLGVGEARARIELRRTEFEANRLADHPDFLETGATGVVGPEAPPVGPGDSAGVVALRGLAISPGRVRGRVCILRSLDDVHKLEPGDILVARAADSGWTPLFLTAGAMVLELGSVLSHAAVVAREYGLPAIVNVEGATRILHDGMEVTVDGHQGRVFTHRAQNDPDLRYEM